LPNSAIEPGIFTPDYKIAETVEIFKQLNPFFQDFILQQLHKLLEYEKTPKKEAKIGFLEIVIWFFML